MRRSNMMKSKTMKSQEEIIGLDEGWEVVQQGITKLKNILEGLPEPPFTSEDYMMLYSTIYKMCKQEPPHDYSQNLYVKYRESFEEYITSLVLPSLREKNDELLLKEFVKRWENHNVMIRWLSRFFQYLERYFIVKRSLPGLNEVFKELSGKIRDAINVLMEKEREGEQTDGSLIKNVLDIIEELGVPLK